MIKAKPLEEISEYLESGTELLNGQYIIQSFLNVGGFGITYLAKDSLDRNVVIKECYPGAFCRRENSTVGVRSRAHENQFAKSINLFLREAQNLAKLKHPNIVGVHQVFQDNQTAYMALDYIDGHELLDIINDKKVAKSPKFIIALVGKMLSAIKYMHDNDILHRDISPDNILISANNEPILIDFGAARVEAVNTNRILSTLSIVKDGYSPQEFYLAGSLQNESSDLYAFGASIYHYIAGELPPNSQLRLAAKAEGKGDPYKPLSGNFKGYSNNFLEAIDKSLKLIPKVRFQSAGEWLDVINPNTDTSVSDIGNLRSIISEEKNASSMDKKLMGAFGAGACVIAIGVFFALSSGDNGTAVATTVAQATDTTNESVMSAEIARLTAEKVAAVEAARIANERAAAEKVTRIATERAAAKEATRIAIEKAGAEDVTRNATGKAAAKEAMRIAIEKAAAEQATRVANEMAAAEEVVAMEAAKLVATKKIQLAKGFQIATDQWKFNFPFDWKFLNFGSKRFVAITGTKANGSGRALLERGDSIYKVNGARIVKEDTVMAVLNQIGAGGTTGQESVKIQFKKKGSNAYQEETIQLLSIRSFELANGIAIQIEQENDTWKTVVNGSPYTDKNTLLTGDIILSEKMAGNVLDNPEKLHKLLSDIGNGMYASLSFSVLRNNQNVEVYFE